MTTSVRLHVARVSKRIFGFFILLFILGAPNCFLCRSVQHLVVPQLLLNQKLAVSSQLLFHFADASTQLLSAISNFLHLHFKCTRFFMFLVDVFLSLGNPYLAYFVLLLEVYNKFVLSFNNVSIIFYSLSCIFKPLFELFRLLALYFVEQSQLLIQFNDFVCLN